MPLWKAILFVAAFLAEESSAFLASPARFLACQEPGVLDRRHKIPLQMGKGKVNRRKKQKQQPKSLGVVGRKERDYIGVAEDGDGVEEGGNVPRVVVMDLDYTLWKPELYTMRGAPFTKEQDGRVIDRSGAVIDLFPGVREALLEIHRADRFRGTRLAIASRTSHKSWAEEVMSLIELEPGLLMHSVFDISEIYTGSKVRHFGKIRKKSGVPYEDMIFFDDWDENCKEVGSLGVMCVECPRGLNGRVWTQGLDMFAAGKERMQP